MLSTAVRRLFCTVTNRLYLLSNSIVRITISIFDCYLEIFSCAVSKTGLAMRDQNSSCWQPDARPRAGLFRALHGSIAGTLADWEIPQIHAQRVQIWGNSHPGSDHLTAGMHTLALGYKTLLLPPSWNQPLRQPVLFTKQCGPNDSYLRWFINIIW